MPWYWTDDIAAALAERDASHEQSATNSPVAIRRQEENLEEVIRSLEEEDEIPLVA